MDIRAIRLEKVEERKSIIRFDLKKYRETPMYKKREREIILADAWLGIFNLFQLIEILSDFNFHCTTHYLREKGIIGPEEFANPKQLAYSFLNGGANVVFRKETWPLLEAEIFSDTNYFGSRDELGRMPDILEMACHYLNSGALERFWDNHEELLHPECPEIVFCEIIDAPEKKAACLSG
jgi:hypothetical protein